MKKKIIISVIILVVFALALTAQFFDVFRFLENKAYDSRMKMTSGYLASSEDIAVVLIDQYSLDWGKDIMGWGWPWPREAYGIIVDYFTRADAASVAFDMIYSEPSLYGPEDDIKFGEAMRRNGRVIQTLYRDSSSPVPVKPVAPIAENARAIVSVESTNDADSVARTMRLDSLAGTSLALSDELPDLSEIPKAKNGHMYIRFYNENNLARYVPFSAADIIMSELTFREAEEQNLISINDDSVLDPAQFEGSHIFCGVYAPGLFDICATPISTTYPGVGVHISQADTILMKKYLRDIPIYITIALILAFCIIGALIGNSVKTEVISSFAIKIFILLLVCAAYIFASYALFKPGFILPVTTVLLSAVVSFLTIAIRNYIAEGKEKIFLKTAFQQYLSKTVIDRLIADPSQLKLGGERREITAYFSDVQGFTSISERLSPEDLTNVLNIYLSAMSDIILESGGLIDKYEGDAIIAFWGAPVAQKDHAKRALEAAMKCQEKLNSMQDELMKITKTPVLQRIGLNTGPAIVGNMGSNKRFDYTMLGDTVNLASRLEGQNKQFGTYLMCSKATKESAEANGFKASFRELGNIAVVGKKEGVHVYEPMTTEKFEANKELYSKFEDAKILYERGSFEQAKEAFKAIADKDPAANKYIAKCQVLIDNPPENWDGIIRATEK